MTSNNVGSMGMAESPAGQKDDTGTSGNLMAKGIIDPTKVVRAALQGAASVAGLLITTEAEVPRKQAAAPAMPGGSMDF